MSLHTKSAISDKTVADGRRSLDCPVALYILVELNVPCNQTSYWSRFQKCVTFFEILNTQRPGNKAQVKK